MAIGKVLQFQKGVTPWNKGKKMPNFHPVGMSGKKHTKEQIEKISFANLGHHRNGWKLSKTTKEKISEGNKGKSRIGHTAWNKDKKCPQLSGVNNGNYISDRTQLKDDHRERGGQLHREWSNSIKKRDGKCKINNQDCKGRLESHHILGWAKFPELRYVINNGITLCHFHHPRKRIDEINLSPYFQELVMNVN